MPPAFGAVWRAATEASGRFCALPLVLFFAVSLVRAIYKKLVT
jgi:hypothetical protein